MAQASHKTKLSRQSGREVRPVSEEELVLGVPDVVERVVVRVEPQAVIVPVHVEHVPVAVRVLDICVAPPMPPSVDSPARRRPAN